MPGTKISQSILTNEALPPLADTPRWPGMTQGNTRPPKLPRPTQTHADDSKAFIKKTLSVKGLVEISAIVSSRREMKTRLLESGKPELFRRQLNIRPPDVPSEKLRVTDTRKERPVSEFQIPAKWRNKKWDVSPIRPIPPKKEKASSIRRPKSCNSVKWTQAEPGDDSEKNRKSIPCFNIPSSPTRDNHQFEFPVPPPGPPPSIRRQKIKALLKLGSRGDTFYSAPTNKPHKTITEMTQSEWDNYRVDMVASSQILAPGWDGRAIDRRFLEQAAKDIINLETSRTNSDIHSRYSAKYRSTPDLRTRLCANSPFLPKATSDDCLKCLLKIPHKKCESHKYIRVGGGYRHGYWYVKCLLEELELQRQRELVMKKRLEAIKEKQVKAIKTYIRTKSGRIVERIIFLSEEDYEAFKQGKGVEDILGKYLTEEEKAGLESWDKDEVKAIKTLIRTKSGRLIEKVVYVSKDEYDAITTGAVDAKDVLKKYAADGETVEGWEEAKMKTIKTFVRTKSGRLIEKTIMISQDDYDKMIKEGKSAAEILKNYLPLEDGQQIEGWESTEPMKAIKTKVRTKSGRIIEKTIMVSAEDYDKLMAGGGDPSEILGKYVKELGEDGGTVEGWEKAEGKPMKVIKTYVRTNSGRLIEKQVVLTEEEYQAFQDAGGDPEFLKKFMKLEKGEKIEDWEKASTIYDDDDPEVEMAKAGQRIVGKDGAVYEVVVDPLTGKKYKKKVMQQESDVDSGIASMQKGKIGRRGKGGIDQDDETPDERQRRKEGFRNTDSDSDFSYKSVVSDGGTRHVQRRRRHEDGTYSDAESYHSSLDEAGQARRRQRRREREHAGSAHSYYSVVSDGGTRHVKRKRKHADGTYSDSESYHSDDSDQPGGRLAEKKKKGQEKAEKEKFAKHQSLLAKKKKNKNKGHDSDSDHSYFSEVSEGGTRTVKKKKKIRDEHGNVLGYEKAETVSTSDDETLYSEVSDGKGGKMLVKKKKLTKEQKVKAKVEKAAKKAVEKLKGGKFKDVGDFSDDSTDTDAADLENMTEEQRKTYYEEKAKRKAEREKKRRDKYGEKYDLMMEKKKELKKLKKLEELRAKGMISPSSDWSIDSDTGEPVRKTEKKELKKQKKLAELREKGLISPSSDWSIDSEGNPVRISELEAQGKRQKKGKKGKDGNEADDESDESEYDPITGKKIKKNKKTTRPGDEGPDKYEYEYDDQGRVIKKKKRWGDESGSEYEYEYDDEGNVRVVKTKKDGAKKGGDSDDDVFEVGADGKIRIRDGKKKIDLSKISDEDLKKLGIDPTLSKKEIAKLLKQKFGGDIEIRDGKKKIATRRASDYGSDALTDDLADDSDLDVTTLRGTKKVNVVWKRGGKLLHDHMKRILDQCRLRDEYAKDLDEKDNDIDFLTHYKLVDPGKLEGYAKAFVVEDDDFDTVISAKETQQALEGVPSVQVMTPKQFDYVFKVLKIDDASQVTFRMFAVISALCERVAQMDPISKYLLEICDILDVQRKMGLYRAMFYCNAESDRDPNFIKAESLRIELMAGGLNWKQQEFILERLQPNAFFEISFLDYLCYVPLFLSMHENIVDNPLDMSDNKYNHMLRRPSGEQRQRDLNPIGQPLKKESVFHLRKQANDLLEGRIDPKDLKPEKVKLLNKIIGKLGKKKRGAKWQTASQKTASLTVRKKAIKAKLKGMTKEAKRRFKDGKRNTDSDSEYSYKSDVSAGGTRHVTRRRKRKDGKYSDAESYHSSQDEGGAARRRKRRRDREHGADSDHSYYSMVSEGGTRHVRRRRRRADGTYSASESYRSSAGSSDDDRLRKSRRRGNDDSSGGVSSNSSDDDEEESDVSVFSDVSEGGTRRVLQKKRIRDADGNVVGYGKSKPTKGKQKGPGSVSTNLASLQSQRNGELLREVTTDSLSQLRDDGESILGSAAWPGQPAENFEQMILAEDAKVPSDFSDSSTEDDVDLSKLTPAQRRQYLAQREKRKQEREKRRREKYGDKYDEIVKNKKEKEAAAMAAELDAAEKERQRQEERRFSSRRRMSTTSSLGMNKQSRPRSMVTYEKGTPRAIGSDNKVDNREVGLSHNDWVPKKETDALAKRRKKSSDAGGDNNGDSLPKLQREKTMINKLPPIPQGRMYVNKYKDDGNNSDDAKSITIERSDGSDNEETKAKQGQQEDDTKKTEETEDYFEVGKDGKVLLKKKKIDLNKISADELRALGIDPNMSSKAIAKRLKQMFGKDVVITEGDNIIGTKGIDEYGPDVDEEALAKDPHLDVDTLSGLKRVNIMMRRGGSALRRHLENVLGLSKLIDRYAKDIDERDADIDFLSHYRLVDPGQLDSYARAFVVEDSDLDTVINSHDVRVALDGIPSIQDMTEKQISYVLKVLHIDEASLITFKMFAVVTALCERVTHMDSLSQRLLEICNLADIERKLDLYNSMFYHNTRSDRSANFVTSESLKIELIAGGLNWKQQQYIMDKMEPNDWGEISFLDFMCYIPLFLSMHDNICENPLDMSNEKYQAPPRRRPPSVQRDMNPLGCSLQKSSAYWIRKHAMEMIEQSRSNATQVSRRYMDIFSKYTSERYMRLKKIEDCRQTNMMSREQTSSSFSDNYEEMIY